MSLRIAMLVAAVCVPGTAVGAEDTVDQPLSPGTEAPDFTASTLEGVPISLSQWEGRVVVLNYLITWYRDAGEHLGMMESLQDAYAAQGMRLLSISLDEGERAMNEVAQLVRDQGIAHPVVRDPEQKTAGLYGVRALPAIFIIDRAGKIAHYHEGYTEGDERRLSQAIAAALEIEPPAEPEEAPEPEAVEEEPEEVEEEREPVCNCFRQKEE